MVESHNLTVREDTTYNVTVEDFATYFVGDSWVLVHNCNTGARSLPARFIGDSAGNVVDRSAVKTALSSQRQARHVRGSSSYNGGGYFRSQGDAQRVLDDFHSGAADVLGSTKSGNIVVRARGVQGFNNNPGAGFVDQATDLFFHQWYQELECCPGESELGATVTATNISNQNAVALQVVQALLGLISHSIRAVSFALTEPELTIFLLVTASARYARERL